MWQTGQWYPPDSVQIPASRFQCAPLRRWHHPPPRICIQVRRHVGKTPLDTATKDAQRWRRGDTMRRARASSTTEPALPTTSQLSGRDTRGGQLLPSTKEIAIHCPLSRESRHAATVPWKDIGNGEFRPWRKLLIIVWKDLKGQSSW